MMNILEPSYRLMNEDNGFCELIEIGVKAKLPVSAILPSGWKRLDDDIVEYVGVNIFKNKRVIKYKEVDGPATACFNGKDGSYIYQTYAVNYDKPVEDNIFEQWIRFNLDCACVEFKSPVVVWRVRPENNINKPEKGLSGLYMRFVVCEECNLPDDLV